MFGNPNLAESVKASPGGKVSSALFTDRVYVAQVRKKPMVTQPRVNDSRQHQALGQQGQMREEVSPEIQCSLADTGTLTRLSSRSWSHREEADAGRDAA